MVKDGHCGAQPRGEVRVAGGAFVMGADSIQPEEGPAKRARVGPFAIDRTEVTVGEFAAFVAATGYVTVAERPLDPVPHPDLPPAASRPASVVFDGSGWRVVEGADWRRSLGPDSGIDIARCYRGPGGPADSGSSHLGFRTVPRSG